MRVNLEKLARFDFSRRDFMKSAAATAGAFVLGTYIPFQESAQAQVPPQTFPYDPNVFLKISPENVVTLVSKHFEMGQGATTGMAAVVAEELDADWSKMAIAFAPNNPSLYNNLFFGPIMATGGTTSTAESWDQMRKVGAAARHMLVTAAANKWSVPVGEIKVEKSVVSHSSGKKATFGELASDAMRVPLPTQVTLKPASQWQLIGTPLPRLDSLGKTTGKAMFALDVRRPGMLRAIVRRPEQFGAKVVSFDATEAKKIAGVVDAVPISTGVAVLATDTWAAIRGQEALKVHWDTSKAEKRSTDEIFQEYRSLAATPGGLTALNRGDSSTALARATKFVDAEFTFPYLAHAPMEPLNCIMELRPDGAEIWSGCQLQSIDQLVAAQVLGFKPEQIKIHTFLGGGSFGRRGNPMGDWIVELSEIAKSFKGRAPVQLVWTRDDDIRGGFYRPMVLHHLKAGMDAQGRISGWQHTIVSQSIFMGTPFERMTVKNGIDDSSVEGVVDTPYVIPDLTVKVHNSKSPVPVLWWRSVGHSHSAYVMETTLDELAHLVGKDPVQFRIDLLSQKPRDAAVVRLAAEKSGWGTPTPKGRGRGFAFHHSFNTHIAMVADVVTNGQTMKVERMVAAVDCGTVVNPDVVNAQVEGAIGFALSSVLRNQITFKNGSVEQRNFDDYEPTRMREMPKVEVHLVPSRERPTGIGEPGVPPVAPAIANAVFAATGKRWRSLPLGMKTL
jgi:isoquinoline 1-oxidoreductase beta subunit